MDIIIIIIFWFATNWFIYKRVEKGIYGEISERYKKIGYLITLSITTIIALMQITKTNFMVEYPYYFFIFLCIIMLIVNWIIKKKYVKKG